MDSPDEFMGIIKSKVIFHSGFMLTLHSELQDPELITDSHIHLVSQF